MRLYEHGSEWRRWDLHVHTPGSVLETQFKGDWEGYIAAIELGRNYDTFGVVRKRAYKAIREYWKPNLTFFIFL